MKKQLTVALGLAVLATPAFASKARLLALGEDVNGSFYINDNRNVFLNASEVNSHKDLVTFEWGAADASGDAGTPNAEGGFYRSVNNMVYGLQFGRNLSFNEGEDAVGNADSVAATNALDFFVGGDAGLKWGAQLTYSDRKSDIAPKAETNVIDLAVGITSGDLSAFLKYGVAGKAEATAVEVERKNAIDLGASYKWDDYTAFGQYAASKYEADKTTDDEISSKSYQVGVGRSKKLNEKSTFFAKLAYVNTNSDQDSTDEVKEMNIPLTFGLEYDATSWLALRGSVSQSLHSKVDDGTVDGTNPETTTVAAGASLKFGDLTVDGMIGNNPDGAIAAADADNTSTGAGQLRTDSLMSRVSMTYRF